MVLYTSHPPIYPLTLPLTEESSVHSHLSNVETQSQESKELQCETGKAPSAELIKGLSTVWSATLLSPDSLHILKWSWETKQNKKYQ